MQHLPIETTLKFIWSQSYKNDKKYILTVLNKIVIKVEVICGDSL
jgi:hypothetical protein